MENFMQKFKVWFFLGTLLLIVSIATHKLIAERSPPVDAFFPTEIVPHFRHPEDVIKDDEPKEPNFKDKDSEEAYRQVKDMV